MTLGFLRKDLSPPEDSSFSLGIQLGTYSYHVIIDEITFSGCFLREGQQKSLITKSHRTNAFQRSLFKTLTSKGYISLALIPTTHRE